MPDPNLDPATWNGSFKDAMGAVHTVLATQNGRFDAIEQLATETRKDVREGRSDTKTLNATVTKVLQQHAGCAARHDAAKDDRARLWTFIKAGWVASGMGTVIGGLIAWFK